MTPLETSQLLTLASLIDNRKLGVETVKMWHRTLNTVDYTDAVEAMEAHFIQSSVYLLPVHIVAGARLVRERKARTARLAQPAIERTPITLDRAEFDRITQTAIDEARAKKAARHIAPDAQPEGEHVQTMISPQPRSQVCSEHVGSQYPPRCAACAAVAS